MTSKGVGQCFQCLSCVLVCQQHIQKRHVSLLTLQIDAGAHLDVADFEGLLPLHQAACTGNVELAKMLVRQHVPFLNL